MHQEVGDAIHECAIELRHLVYAHDGDPTRAAAAVERCIQRLLDRPDLPGSGMQRSAKQPDSWTLYYDPKLAMNLGRFAKGRHVRPHNHGTWNATCVYAGAIDYAGFRRFDDGTKDGYADVRLVERRRLSRGEIALCPPPPGDIHELMNVEEDAFVMEITGKTVPLERQYYDVEAKSYALQPSPFLMELRQL